MEATDFFYSLTPDKVLDAVEAFNVRCTGRLLQLNSYENRVYDVELDSNPWGAKAVVAKFYRPGRWTKEQILEEHQFLFDLIEYELPVVAPLKGPDGGSIFSVKDTNILVGLFPKTGGRNPEELSNEMVIRLGRLLARIHNIGGIKSAEHRLRLDPITYGWDNLDFLDAEGSIPDNCSASYFDAAETLLEEIEPLFEGIQNIRIHGDCHLGNILWGKEGPFLVDFDDMVSGPAIQDLWLAIPGRDRFAKEQFELFLDSYESMREFDRSTLRLIEPLRALRYINYAAWIAKRWSDPAFPRLFPHFGSDKYWQEQTADLREQLALIREG